MEKLQQIIAVAGSVTTLLAALLTFVIKFIKSAKAKIKAEQALKIVEIIQPLIVEAEKFVHYTGKEKKQFVLTKANQFALENGMNYNAAIVSKLIEDIVQTTKQVNARDSCTIIAHAKAEVSINDKAITE